MFVKLNSVSAVLMMLPKGQGSRLKTCSLTPIAIEDEFYLHVYCDL